MPRRRAPRHPESVALARTLPPTLPRRLANAARMTARTDEASFELLLANGFLLRLRGLTRLRADQIAPLLFPRTRSLHTFWMRVPIDVVWLELGEGEARVLGVEAELRPRRLARAPRAARGRTVAALELAAGDARLLGLKPAVVFTLAGV